MTAESEDELERQAEYLRAQLDEISREHLKLDAQLSAARYEVRQRRQGFELLSKLYMTLEGSPDASEVYVRVLHQTIASLKMDRAVVLTADGDDSGYRPAYSAGYIGKPKAALMEGRFDVPAELIAPSGALLVTRASFLGEFERELIAGLGIPCFIALPVVGHGHTAAILVVGRMKEAKPFNPPLDEGDVYTLRAIAGFLGAMVQRAQMTALEARAAHVRETFGRYISDEVVKKLLAAPDALSFGGEKVPITIMMTDLRGFTQMCESVPPELVVRTLNHYFGVMTDVIQKYGGVIDDFIGDAILVVFGEPVRFEDHAARAVACALQMQLAMTSVNEWATSHGLPSLEMGIGINTGDAVVGNIGSEKRAKHSVIGRTVNIAARVESYTTGGQVLITQATLEAIPSPLRIERQMDVKPKGVDTTLTIHEVSGIGAPYEVELATSPDEELAPLARAVDVFVVRLSGKDAAAQEVHGKLVAIGARDAALETRADLPPLSNVKLRFTRASGADIEFYAKVLSSPAFDARAVLIRFTSMPSDMREYLDAALHERGQCPRPSVRPPPPLQLP